MLVRQSLNVPMILILKGGHLSSSGCVNICRDMETVSGSGDLKNGHMVNVLVSKLPVKVAQEWAKNKEKKKMDTMVSEDIFRELMQFLKSEKQVTKDILNRQETISDKTRTHISYVTGQTFTVQQKTRPTIRR